MRVHRPLAVDMMDNASALPTCPQRQQQKQAADSRMGENHPHDFTMKLNYKWGCEQLRRSCLPSMGIVVGMSSVRRRGRFLPICGSGQPREAELVAGRQTVADERSMS